MSGPKVICIVTREEVEALCRNLLALVDDAIARLRAAAERHDRTGDPVLAGLAERRARLERLFAGEHFLDLQKQAPREVAFLQGEVARIRAEAVAAQEARRTRSRRLQDAARSVAAALRAEGRQPAVALEVVIARAAGAGEGELAAMQATVDQALRELGGAQAAAGPSATGIALAQRLAAGEVGQTLAGWLADQPASGEASAADIRLQRLLAEIETLDDSKAAEPYLGRANAIAVELSDDRRALLTDSLVLDLVERKREREMREAAVQGLCEARVALASLDIAAARAMVERLDATISAGGAGDSGALAREALDLVAAEMRARAAAARRKAVFEGLAALGYEVREGMATAWARDGRIVVRKPGAADYGVELGAPEDVARLQVRVVRAEGAVSNPARDRDAETVWCAEFERLRSLLARKGAELSLERALAPGAQPVKTVPFPGTIDTSDAATVRRGGLRTP
jgi:hypothetical protein